MNREQLIAKYFETHTKSLALHKRAAEKFAANGATHTARILDPFRPYVTHANGSLKWDVDGHEYIDFIMGHGALILGHSHPRVVEAVQSQMAKGVHFGENHELEVQWADLIHQMMPVAERIEFCASGQEANMLAFRLARLSTGRKKVLRFAENFHGWADEVTLNPDGAVCPEVTRIPMNDMDILEVTLASGEYALVLAEGGGAHMAGQIPWDRNFIKALPAVAEKHGTLACIDEVVTGFRESRGGWQELAGVKPHLTTLGKCVGGGLGVGAVAGRADVFEGLQPGAVAGRRMSHSGTWNANPLTSSAGVAACEIYADGAPQKKTAEMGAYLRDAGNSVLRQKGISGLLYGRTVIHTYFGPSDLQPENEYSPPTKSVKTIMGDKNTNAIKSLLGLHLLQRDIATMGGRFFVMSAAHSEADIDRTISGFAESLDDMIAEGVLSENMS
jgi:glutamate-1-semialdehyde 2,1-aminomutase